MASLLSPAGVLIRLVNLFESMGIATGIDLDGLVATAELCERALGRELYGRVTRSGLSPLLH